MDSKNYSLKKEELFRKFKSSENGLSSKEAEERIKIYGLNETEKKEKRSVLSIFFSQFKSPLILILIFASIISGVLGDLMDTLIIISIVILNSFLGFYQEYKSEKAIEKLREYLSFSAKVLRDGKKQEINVKNLVPGDIVFFNIGDIVPADIRLIDTEELTTNESFLTGESLPVSKTHKIIDAKDLPISKQKNMVFMGSIVSCGNAIGIVVLTGENTEFGKTAKEISLKEPPTDFEKNMKSFGGFLLKVILYLTIIIFFANAVLNKGVLESLLFALALAVGITPEMLPIIITISLSNSAIKLSKNKVVVKKLSSIEDLGNIDVLCVDKTGTLTENKLQIQNYIDFNGKKDEEIIKSAYMCRPLKEGETAIRLNPIDLAITEYIEDNNKTPEHYKKIEDVEFDYTRKRMSVIVNKNSKNFLITKGSALSVLEVCKYVKDENKVISIRENFSKIKRRFEELNKKGYKIVAVAYKNIEKKRDYLIEDEKNMIFLGFICFLDPPKKSAKESIKKLRELKVELKLLTGDDDIITKEICEELDIKIRNKIITGFDLDKLSSSQFLDIVEKNNVFARITPEQKYRIIESLTKKGHIVGFLGDGVNDAPALKIADVGITVNTAVDVAKDCADIILLEEDLEIIAEGIKEGRKTFVNINKYILNTISANFGNMFSLSISSLYFSFIPLLPSQILLNNFISDIPLTTISTDNVDPEYLEKPQRWNIKAINSFMIFFGLISSVFDIATMCLIWFVLAPGNINLFRTAWFVESSLSEIIITFVIRTKKSMFKSRPSNWLALSSLFGVILIFFFVYFIPNDLFDFEKLSLLMIFWIFVILILYVIIAEIGKIIFYRILHKRDN
jgi:P-type Mg2+ transporter